MSDNDRIGTCEICVDGEGYKIGVSDVKVCERMS